MATFKEQLIADGLDTQVINTLDPILKLIEKRLPSFGTPVDSAVAGGTLTFSATANDGETIVLGDTTFEWDTDGSVTSGNVSLDISTGATASTEDLTVDTQPTADDTMTIGSTVYTFKATAAAAGEISIGSDLAETQTNIKAAVNGTDELNTANPVASLGVWASNAATVTAKAPGTAGDSIATTETFTAGTNVFGAATLSSGADMAIDDQLDVLAAAFDANDQLDGSAVVSDGPNTVAVSYKEGGIAGNLASTETMSDGAWGAATLTGGIDGTEGYAGKILVDADNFYTTHAISTKASAVWEKVAKAAL